MILPIINTILAGAVFYFAMMASGLPLA